MLLKKSVRDAPMDSPPKTSVAWPHRAQRLRTKSSRLHNSLLNVFLILLTSLYFVYAALAIAYNGSPVNKVESALAEAARYGPTIFPIVFAAVVGRAIKSVFLWRLQEGERTGFLDLLLGSTTITNTVTTQVKLRTPSLVGALLVVLWALAPIGGQASLRAFTFEASSVTQHTTLQYMDVNNSWAYYMGSDVVFTSPPVNAIFLAGLAAPAATKNSTSDSWGNLKVPMIEALPSFSEDNAQDWLTIDTSIPTVYSSLLGIPISGVTRDVNSTFNMETAYWYLDCPILESVATIPEMSALLNSSNPPPFPKSTAPPWLAAWGHLASNTSSKISPGLFRCNSTDSKLSPRTIQYVGWNAHYNKGPGNAAGTVATCTITTSYVELSVACTGTDCTVPQMRRSTLPHRAPGYTNLDSCQNKTGFAAFDWFAGFFATVTGSPVAAGPTSLQAYFIDPGNPFNMSTIRNLEPLYTIGNHSFAMGLAQLLNTYWISSLGSSILALGHPESFDGLTGAFGTVDTSFFGTPAAISTSLEIMVCNWGWIAMLLIATLAMCVAMMVKIRLGCLIWIPDLLMNVSTLTRDNLYCSIPPGGSMLSDAERSRHLNDLMMRFGDVHPAENVGHLSIGQSDADGGCVARFRRERDYF